MWSYTFIIWALLLTGYQATACRYVESSKRVECLHAKTVDQLNTEIDATLATHATGENIKELTISECTIDHFSLNSLKISPYVTELNIHDCEINVLPSEAFKNFQRLKILAIYDNKVTDTNAHVFKGLNSLKDITILRNEGINFSKADLLNELPGLESVEV